MAKVNTAFENPTQFLTLLQTLLNLGNKTKNYGNPFDEAV